MKKRLLELSFLLCFFTFNLAFVHANNECFTVQVSSEAGQVGDTIAVDISVKGFDQVIGMQYTLEWETNNLAYVGVNDFNLTGLQASNFGPAQPGTAGHLALSWIDNTTGGITLSDGSVIYRVYFEVLNSGAFPVSFVDSPVPPEFVVESSEILENYTLIGGQITTAAGDPLAIEDACIQVTGCFSPSSEVISPTITGSTINYTYAWSGPNGFASTSPTLSGISANGTYTLQVTDNNGQSIFASFQLVLDGGVDIQYSVSPDICGAASTGQIAVSVLTSGTYSYAWSNGATTSTLSNLPGGSYTLTITNTIDGCVQVESFVVAEEADAIVSSEITHASCTGTANGAIDLTVTALIPPNTFTFLWSNGATTEDIQNLSPGSYTITITDQSSCTLERSYLVEGNFNLNVTATVVDESCSGGNGSIDLHLPNPTLNYTFLWSNGSETEDVTDLSAGNYSVSITTTDGCLAIRNYTVSDYGMVASTNYDCISPTNIQISAILWAGGPGPYTFTWSTGDIVVTSSLLQPAVISVTENGTYSLTVTNANGTCSTVLDNIVVDCAGANEVELYPYSAQDTLEVGDSYCVEVRVDGFVDIESFQFSLSWNPLALQFDNISSLNVPGLATNNFGILPALTDNGMMSVSWNDPGGSSNIVTLPDGSHLFEVCFTVLPSAPVTNFVQISQTPTPIEFVNGSDDILNVGTGNSTLVVSNFTASSEVQLGGGMASANPGETVCIPVTVEDFGAITSMQFSINWDPTKLNFVGVQEFDLPYLTINSFGLTDETDDGILRFLWFDQGVQGITVPNGTAIFEICFQVTGSAEVALVNFTGTPIDMEATNVDLDLVQIIPTSGVISISGIPVWPGDTDNSEIVDHFDLLNIGLVYGETGPVRANASLLWQEQLAFPWTQSTPNSAINAVHADTDGNGMINENDVQALQQNWGEETNFWNEGDENRLPVLPQALTLTEAAIMVESQTVTAGQEATFNILFGEETSPVEEAYGLAFTVVYDDLAVVPGSASASFANSWLGNVNGELITIFRDRPSDHRIDIAISRIDQLNRGGQGAIAQLNLTIEDVILRDENYQMSFQIENVRIINAQEELIPTVQPETFSEITGTTGTNQLELSQKVELYPVPTTDMLYLRVNNLSVESVEILSTNGKVQQHWEKVVDQFSTTNLPAGTYILRLYTAEGIVHKRFVKI